MKYCYGCGIEYKGNRCPKCKDTIYTEKPNSQTKIKHLISIKNCLGYLINDLTREMDSYLKYQSNDDVTKNYIYDKYKDAWAVRCTGATRGHIKVDENDIIQGIELYKDSDEIYKPGIRECFDKYIGMKIVLEECSNGMQTCKR